MSGGKKGERPGFLPPLLNVDFQARFPIEEIRKRKPTLWRYREALPVDRDENIVSFEEGFTPLIPLELYGREVWVKQDHLFPTGSIKDRGASILISKVKELGISRVVEDSSGNAGSAVAAYCAKAGIECDIFVPASASKGKLSQIRSLGANLITVSGSREDAARAAREAAEKTYDASHCRNPFFFHGTKTFAFEVCEQLGWTAPDTMILPLGNGTLVLGAYIGFMELARAGVVSRVPKIVAVQSAGCAPVYDAFKKGLREVPGVEPGETMAEGIAVAEPVRGGEILDALRDTNGEILIVDEEEIESALKSVSEHGYYVEPTAAVAMAGAKRYIKGLREDEILVAAFTGHGLGKYEEKKGQIT